MKIQSITVEEEYRKNSDLKRKYIQELLEWIKAQPHLPPVSEFQAIQFYYSNYYDMDRTKRAVDNYYTYRTHFDDIFLNMDVQSEEILNAHNSMTIACLPGVTREGYRVIFWKWNDPNPATFSHPACVKYYGLFVMTLLNTYGTCPGYIAFLDFDGSKWAHAFALHLKTLRHGMKFIQEAKPMRLKIVEIFNFPLNGPLPVIKPFINPEMYHRLRFNKSWKQVHDYIPEEMFPCDYPGGKAPSIKELREKWWNMINARREQFLEEERVQKVDESKRIVESKKGWFGLY